MAPQSYRNSDVGVGEALSQDSCVGCGACLLPLTECLNCLRPVCRNCEDAEHHKCKAAVAFAKLANGPEV
jgi:hypothetical protein